MTFIEIALRPKSINRFVFLVIFSLILIYLSQPIYGTTDDKILAGFIDGSYTGELEIQTIFIQPIISLILTPFYYVLPSFGWYIFSYPDFFISVFNHSSIFDKW
jgi:hypothetical protein